ncbi:MAG: hypothetical protein Q9218_004728 [Villophora microphyllina]
MLFAFQAIASHLLAHENGEVVLIATTDVSLPRLRDILIDRLARHDQSPEFQESGYVYSKQPTSRQLTSDRSSRVSPLLERIRLSRVFDFPGVVEAIAEFTASVDENDRRIQKTFDAKERRSRGIADSEDEDEDEDGISQNSEGHTAESPNILNDRDRDRPQQRASTNMIVVDNIANVVGSMMTKSQVQGSVHA